MGRSEIYEVSESPVKACLDALRAAKVPKPAVVPEFSKAATDKKLPSCSLGNFDCANCSKPMVAQSGRGDLAPCDGTIYFCRFATASTTTQACTQYSLRNFNCTHGGGSCSTYREKRFAYGV